MENRTLEITIRYAKDLNKVNLISKMDVYVVVSISGGDKNSRQKTKTTVDHDGDANPTWNFPMKFTVEELALLQNRLMLDFKLKCEGVLGDKNIGEVHVPIKDLLDFPAKGRSGAKKFVSYQVKKPSGKPKGQLTFSYEFRGKTTTFAAAPPPVTEVHEESMSLYPVLEPSLLYPPPQLHPVTLAPEGCGGLYPSPPGNLPAGGPIPEWYWPPAAGCGYYPPLPTHGYTPPPPPSGYIYPPPLVQLAPYRWIIDWRYNF